MNTHSQTWIYILLIKKYNLVLCRMHATVDMSSESLDKKTREDKNVSFPVIQFYPRAL